MLGEIATIVDCEHKTAPIDPGGEYFAVGTPAMRGNAINYGEARRISRETFESWTRRLTPQEGDLLFAREAPVGPIVRIPTTGNVAAGQRTVLIRPDAGTTDSRFLFYLLASPRVQAVVLSLAEGSTVPHVNVADVRSLEVGALPDIRVQRSISDVLGALDDKIAVSRRLVSKADGLIAALVRPHLVDRRPLWDAVQFVFGEAFKGAAFVSEGSGRPLIRIRDLKSQRCQVWTTESRQRERVVVPGEVLVGMDAEFRAVRWSGPAALLNQRVLLAHSHEYGDALVRELLGAPLSRIERSKSGTTVIHLNKRDLQEEVVAAPHPSKVPDLRLRVDPLWRQCIAAEQEVASLAATRDELLPLLMNGRITVRDAERRVEAQV